MAVPTPDAYCTTAAVVAASDSTDAGHRREHRGNDHPHSMASPARIFNAWHA